MKRTISTQTTLEPYGLLRLSGQVEKDKTFDPITEGFAGSPFDVQNLKVIDPELDYDITELLETLEIEMLENVLIEKYCEEEEAAAQDYKDRMIDEAIERGRLYAGRAYA